LLLRVIGPLRRRFIYLLLCSAILSILPWTLWTHPLVQQLSDLAMVTLVGYGVWEVFARIRRLEDAAREDDENKLIAYATAPDEVGALAGALAENLRALRRSNEADRCRLALANFHEQQIQKLAADLNAWVAGQGELDVALGRLSQSQDPIYADTAQQMLANACIARRLLEVQEVRGRIGALLTRMVGLDDGLRELGEHLRRLLPHDRAFLSGGGGACYRIDEQGVEHLEALPTLADDHCLRMPLAVHSRKVGDLTLWRANGPFSPTDAVAMAPVAPVLASALARMKLEWRLRGADRMAIVGAMGRVMAHQLRNPINNLMLPSTT
jgi:HAMP domain-containing protein